MTMRDHVHMVLLRLQDQPNDPFVQVVAYKATLNVVRWQDEVTDSRGRLLANKIIALGRNMLRDVVMGPGPRVDITYNELVAAYYLELIRMVREAETEQI